MPVSVPDQIQKTVLLHAPLARVWKALTDSKEFGEWFGVRFEAPFVAGVPIRGIMKPTTADLEVAKMQQPYAGRIFDITIDRIEPQRLFSFRWHPFAIEPNVDYSKEPTTLIVFTLEEKSNGVLLTVTESGFDRIPLERRAQAFTANEGGWTKQLTLIEKHLARSA
jgi:uncharacterized protein YndB with AHSA1/START domain